MVDYYWIVLVIFWVLVPLACDVAFVLLMTFAFSMLVIKCVDWLVRGVYYIFWGRRRVNKGVKKN